MFRDIIDFYNEFPDAKIEITRISMNRSIVITVTWNNWYHRRTVVDSCQLEFAILYAVSEFKISYNRKDCNDR